MNWQDREKTGFTITCGDGKSYTPLWLAASTQKGIEYNIATFEFKDLAGTLVERGEPKGARYPIEIFFQGDTHLDIAREFEISARDKRAWVISHPYYDSITVQPTGLNIDNSAGNVSKITSLVIETISTNSNVVVISAPDKIIEDKAATDTALKASYTKDIPNPKTSSLLTLQKNITGIYDTAVNFIYDDLGYADFLNAYNSVNSLLTDSDIKIDEIIDAAQGFISLPIMFSDTLVNRMNMFVNMLAYLNNTVLGISLFDDKKAYENNAGTIIGCMIAASVTNIGTAYDNRNGVLNVIGTIIDNYNGYLTNLDALQSLNGSGIGNYIPDPNAITRLSHLTNYAVNALLAIANDSKQERTIILEENSNMILLANRFYGLKSDDSTIEYFRTTNNIQQNEVFEIMKGRKILYYV